MQYRVSVPVPTLELAEALATVLTALGYAASVEVTDLPQRPVPDTGSPVVEAVTILQQAAAAGSLLGRKGGKARANALTPQRRAEIARMAAAKRWATEHT